jgi:RNA polymerase sigma-70 factor (ECF subfamily)
LDEESRLIRKAQGGDAEAFAQLYRSYVQAIYRYLYSRLSDATVAEDLTAEVFMRAVDGLPRFSDRGLPFGAWLFRIARDRLVDFYRQSGRRPVVDLDESLSSDGPDPSEMAETAVVLNDLHMALNRLTGDQRNVIQFRFMEDWSLEETARAMNKTVNAVKALQHRALSTLHRLLQGEAGASDGE